MKSNKDRCMDELFDGLVNPNAQNSTTIEQPPSQPVVSTAERTVVMPQPSIDSSVTSNKQPQKKHSRKKGDKLSVLVRISKHKMEKVTWLANYIGINKSEIIEAGLTFYLNKYEEKHGPIYPSAPKSAADFIK